MAKQATVINNRRPGGGKSYLKRSWMVYSMLLLPMAYFIIFKYIPMMNIVMAFQDFSIFKGVQGSPFVGFKHFIRAFGQRDFINAVRNTITLNLLDLIVGFPAPIMLAIILNELVFKRFKRVTQTIVYMPHFLSWIIISGIAMQLFAPGSGVVNKILEGMGLGKVDLLMDKNNWVGTYVFLGLWKEIGWNTIIYLAAITGISAELYEAAEVDGAGRLRKIWHITLPGLRPTIVVLLIMSLGRILGIEFDRPYVMSNTMVMEVADVISTYVYRTGVRSRQYSYATAIGLFQSVICVTFLVVANTLSKKFGERGIW